MVEPLLKAIMRNDWNVHIECKGKGREHEMTYEATANKVATENMSLEEKVKCFYPIHATGGTLKELLNNLVFKTEKWIM